MCQILTNDLKTVFKFEFVIPTFTTVTNGSRFSISEKRHTRSTVTLFDSLKGRRKNRVKSVYSERRRKWGVLRANQVPSPSRQPFAAVPTCSGSVYTSFSGYLW
jgi:hypothetical protein